MKYIDAMNQIEDVEQKKVYLKQYRNAIRREKRILDEIQRLKKDKVLPAIFNGILPEGADVSDLSGYTDILEKEIDRLRVERLEKVMRYRDIENKIRMLGDEVEQETLRLRYINGLTWEEVADEMGYTYRHIMRIHNDALNRLKLS